MRSSTRSAVLPLLASAFAAVGCGRIWYDPLPRDRDGGGVDAAVADGARSDSPQLDAGAPAPLSITWDRVFAPAAVPWTTRISLGPTGEVAVFGGFDEATDFGGGVRTPSTGGYRDAFVALFEL